MEWIQALQEDYDNLLVDPSSYKDIDGDESFANWFGDKSSFLIWIFEQSAWELIDDETGDLFATFDEAFEIGIGKALGKGWLDRLKSAHYNTIRSGCINREQYDMYVYSELV